MYDTKGYTAVKLSDDGITGIYRNDATGITTSFRASKKNAIVNAPYSNFKLRTKRHARRYPVSYVHIGNKIVNYCTVEEFPNA